MDNTQTLEEVKDADPAILIDEDQVLNPIDGMTNNKGAQTQGLPSGHRPSLL